MTSLTIATTTDYRPLAVTEVDSLTFTNQIRTPDFICTASFQTSQIAQTFFAWALSVTGSSGRNLLDLYMSAGPNFSAEEFSFANWSTSDSFRIFGTTGNDVIRGASVATQIFGDAGNDYLEGRSLNDSMFGGEGNDRLQSQGGVANGGEGDDWITWGRGSVDGGGGTDGFSASFLDSAGPIVLDVRDGGGGRLVDGAVTLISIERLQVTLSALADQATGGNFRDLLFGAAGQDTLKGQGGNDLLVGGLGDDVLIGGAGPDVLVGGSGQEVMFGGSGSDRFQFYSKVESPVGTEDSIADFTQGADKIDLSGYVDGGELTNHGPLRFIGDAAFSGQLVNPDDPFFGFEQSGPYEVRYEKTTTGTLVQIGYAETDDVVVWQIRLAASLDLTSADFIL